MSTDSYAREKFGNAVHSLATSAKPIQERLVFAFTDIHTLMNPDHQLRDPENQAELDVIFAKMTADKSDPEEGYAPFTLRRLSDDDAQRLAGQVVDLAYRLEGARDHALEELGRAAGAKIPLDL